MGGMVMNRFFAIMITGSLLSLAACGGGGGTSATLTDTEREQIASDPRVVRLGSILERADTLLVPTLHLRYSLSAQGQTVSDSLALITGCHGTRCVVEDGSEITLQDLIDPATDIDLTEVSIGSREGFDTVTARGGFEVTENIPEGTITSAPTAASYGIWGEYGFAAAEISSGSMSGSLEGVPFTGDFASATSYVVGDAVGTNPEGMGSATWSGIAEAASTRNFQRRQGSATVTIADLSRPRVGVAIDIEGYDITAPEWASMSLRRGHFATRGKRGGDDEYLAGNFHGPNHEEVYGVFDTGAYVGAFGAMRASGAGDEGPT